MYGRVNISDKRRQFAISFAIPERTKYPIAKNIHKTLPTSIRFDGETTSVTVKESGFKHGMKLTLDR